MTLMTRWPQLTPKDIRQLTLPQVHMLLSGGGNPTFKTMAEYKRWAQQLQR